MFEGEKLSVSLERITERMSVSLVDPQSAKQTNVILLKERNEHPNAIFEGDMLSAPLSVSLADPQTATQADVILMKRCNG